MKIAKLTAIAGLPLVGGLLSGCITHAGSHVSETVATYEPFRTLSSQRQVRLQRPLLLLPAPTTSNSVPISSDSAVLIDVRDSGEKNLPLHIPKSLPPGTVIEFDRFDKELDNSVTVFPFFLDLFPSPSSYTTWIRVPHLKLPKHVYFEYCWGYGSYLWPAPWESKDSQPKYVGASGHRYKAMPQ